MDQDNTHLSPEIHRAARNMSQKAGELRQSSSNNFLVSLEGLMLAAIAWESIGKPKVWISNLSKATTAIGLVVTGIFAYSAINDRLKANRIQAKLDSYGVDEVSLACEVPPVETAEHPVHQPHHPHQPRNVIHADGAEASKMQEFDLQHAM